MNQRREHARRFLSLPSILMLLDGSLVTNAHLIDLSLSGVGFLSDVNLDVYADYDLRFHFPSQVNADQVRVEIVYSIFHPASGYFRCGARIRVMSPETKQNLIDFVTTPITL